MSLQYPSFVGCGGGGGGGGGGGSRLFNQLLTGAINGVNTTYTTASDFTHDGSFDEAVYLNGQKLQSGAGNDYTVSESGGPGTGYDTVTLAIAPIAGDVLAIDYQPA
ncbi:MAG: hypothetical protein KGS10_05460 [Chloroflexi bacterium]|nr:hypothetical protein [Chloroflexota bacterium]